MESENAFKGITITIMALIIIAAIVLGIFFLG